jgi:hypothetical protein
MRLFRLWERPSASDITSTTQNAAMVSALNPARKAPSQPAGPVCAWSPTM